MIESIAQIFVIKPRHMIAEAYLKNERGESKNLNDSYKSTLEVVRSGNQTGNS